MENEMLDGVIYKIEICNEFYIGSTIETLKERQRKHNISLKKKTYKLYETCKANDITKITLIKIEKVKVNNKLELKIIEQKYINELQPTLNMLKAYRTEEEIKNYDKEYRENNKEKERLRHKKYRDNNKEKIKNYDKEYKDKNKEKIKEKNKIYNKENRGKLNEKNKEKVKCEFCEKEMNKSSLSKHKKKYCKKVIN